MQTLTHGQEIFSPKWGRGYTCTVGTVEGYSAKNKIDVNKAVDRAIENGHELAYTINIGTVLTNSVGYYEREDKRKAAATEVQENEEVLIEGRKYKVKLVGKRYSDPIHFIAV